MSRKERLKVYHGIPKSIVDSNTVFYMSCDSLNPEINCLNSSKVGSSPTVYGTSCTGGSLKFIDLNYLLCTLNTSKVLTIDFILNMPSTTVSNTTILRLSKSDTEHFSVGFGSDNTFHCDFTTPDLGTKYNWIPNVSTVFKLGINHIRICFSDSDVLFYINGIYYSNKAVGNYPSVIKNDLLPNINALRLYFAYPTSDLHVSNIDRGDYFPNLPQDFIDGKAIIKPRMGQQQIKGDPLYSQETTDIVKIGTNVNEPQITCSRTSGNWTNGDTIKVKGLNNEIISGVIDSDTALARVKQVINSKQIFVLNSVQKLSVNDVVRFNIGNSYSPEAIISKIDSDTNTITLSTPLSGWEVATEYYLVETTSATSSPIVKSSDGTTITGTWSNLGTNEATFTLGTNSSLTNQDLYVTYSLNIPAGNSDFTELPYSIEKVYDEVGNELEEVSEIVIKDDFKGKVFGSLKECPHIVKYDVKSSLIPISEFTLEANTYPTLSEIDGVFTKVINLVYGNIPQCVMSFNIIEIVERKLNRKIPSQDKIAWLNANIDTVTLKWTGKAECPGGNKVYLAPWRSDQGWDIFWIKQVRHNTPDVRKDILHVLPAKDLNNGMNYIKPSLMPDGYISFIAFTEATDGVSNSIIYTDYVSIEVKLIKDSTFTTFYTENKRARENPCNPILIQKETKTIKRYLPSKECFVTECLTYGTTPTNDIQSKELSRCDYYYATTLGTGSYNKDRDWYSECLGKFGLNLLSHKFTNDYLQTTADNKVSNIKFVKGLSQSYFNNNGWTIPTSPILNQSSMYFFPSLVCVENEIKLKTVFRELSPIGETSNKGILLYSLPNRPLIK